jgi:FAD/FMN-containing dehydrogenase
MKADLGNRNWFGDIQCFERPCETPSSVEELRAILTDATRFPSPVRPMGSRHSMTACMAAEVPGRPGSFGTAVDMTRFSGEIEVDPVAKTVKVPAGLTFFEAAHQLRPHGLQFRVNTELGSLTMGAAACGATKDSSFPGEPGQVCHDVIGMRLVTPQGEVRELKEGDPDFAALRCSYGLFGIVTELTFQAFDFQFISLNHDEMSLEEFTERAPDLQRNNALFLYLFPYHRPPRIVLERRQQVGAKEGRETSVRLEARNFFWREGLHRAAHFAQKLPFLEPVLREIEQKVVREFLDGLDLESIDPVSQIVDFRQGAEHFTFSMWAFPAAEFPRILRQYFEFCRSDEAAGLRTILPHVSYHISQDQSSPLSYSHAGDVWTLDPIGSGVEPGWHEFLKAFNQRACNDWGGVPLFNQTPHLTRELVARAFGERLSRFEEVRRRFDPQGRMLNDYFARLLQG